MYEEEFVACDECGLLFTPKFQGATTCYSCWSQTAAGQAWRRRKDAERGRGQQQAKSGAGASSGPEVRVEYRDLPGFDLAMCRRLLQLCHPDKHSNSDASVKVTQWLNDRMRELKGR